MILDTNFLGALDAGDTGAKALATEIESEGLPARIPTPVVFEVFYGIEGADDPDELLPRYEALFASKPRVELTDSVARRGGRLYARHEASDEKQRLDLVDAMVAAIGLDERIEVADADAETLVVHTEDSRRTSFARSTSSSSRGTSTASATSARWSNSSRRPSSTGSRPGPTARSRPSSGSPKRAISEPSTQAPR